MKRFFCLVGLALLTLCVYAGSYKVLEKSDRRAPEWIGETGNGYIVTEVSAQTLGECEAKTLDELTSYILRSIAVNLSENITSDKTKQRTDDEVSYTETFVKQTKMRSAQLPFLSDISLSKVSDVYWEKRQDKKTKEVSYMYSALYPFSESQMRTLRNKFEAIDKEKVDKLSSLQQQLSSITDFQQIKQAEADLDELLGYFFDDVRLAQVRNVQKLYNDLYNQMSLHSEWVAKDTYQCQLMLQGRKIACAVMPRLRAKCATQLEVISLDGGYRVTCNTLDCLPEEDNTIDVTLSLGKKTLRYKITLII